jgi:hypothetical protein
LENWMFFIPVLLRTDNDKLQPLKWQSIKSLLLRLHLEKLQLMNLQSANSSLENFFSE